MAEGDHITLATTCSLEIMLWPPGNEGPQHAKHSYNVCCYKYTHAAQIAAPSCGMPLCYTCYAWQPRPSLLLLDALHEVIVPLQEVLVRTLFTHGPPPRGDESGLGSNAQVGEAWRSMLVVHRCSMKIQWKQTEGKNSMLHEILWKYCENMKISASRAGLLEHVFSKWRSTEPMRGSPVIFTLPGLQIKCGTQKCTSDIKTGQNRAVVGEWGGNMVATMDNIEVKQRPYHLTKEKLYRFTRPYSVTGYFEALPPQKEEYPVWSPETELSLTQETWHCSHIMSEIPLWNTSTTRYVRIQHPCALTWGSVPMLCGNLSLDFWGVPLN